MYVLTTIHARYVIAGEVSVLPRNIQAAFQLSPLTADTLDAEVVRDVHVVDAIVDAVDAVVLSTVRTYTPS